MDNWKNDVHVSLSSEFIVGTDIKKYSTDQKLSTDTRCKNFTLSYHTIFLV